MLSKFFNVSYMRKFLFLSFSRRIILNNPKKRNALSLSMLESLRENILTDADSDDLRVIIISGG